MLQSKRMAWKLMDRPCVSIMQLHLVVEETVVDAVVVVDVADLVDSVVAVVAVVMVDSAIEKVVVVAVVMVDSAIEKVVEVVVEEEEAVDLVGVEAEEDTRDLGIEAVGVEATAGEIAMTIDPYFPNYSLQ